VAKFKVTIIKSDGEPYSEVISQSDLYLAFNALTGQTTYATPWNGFGGIILRIERVLDAPVIDPAG
jgi:hypothetical protein